ncbi:VWA domain-containing protein [Saccharothrix xinjiangensis]|uniref:VWA domain-containing protein n=1 Tax=Saccharothrix xinjiangensis TaxID=204798 RepID=A0ABV9XUT4_9PSEU
MEQPEGGGRHNGGSHNTVEATTVETVVQANTIRGGVTGRLYRFTVEMPPAVRNAVVALLVAALLAGGAHAALTWVLPQFAPTYKTEFLVDLSGAGAASEDFAASVESLGKALGNSGDDDAIALRGFGGECGAEDNTTQLVGFGKGNRDEVGNAVRAASPSGRATLLRGVVEATADFSEPFSQDAKQVNRIIVVTRNGVDACDDDRGFVEEEMRDRVAAAGLAIEFRFVGYQLDDDHRDNLGKLATGAAAPPPLLPDSPDELRAALEWVTNVEPVLRSARQVIDIFDPTVARLDEAVQAIVDGRLDVADRAIDDVAPITAEAEFENLRSRARTPAAVDLHAKAVQLRDRQARVIEAARQLLDAARSGTPFDERFEAFRRAAEDYNAQVDAVNEVLAALRATSPGATR